MSETPDSDGLEPFRAAIVAVLPPDLLEELRRVEEQCRKELAEALVAKGRATDWLRTGRWERPFEHMEAELETEHGALVRYHLGKLAKRVRWILEAWKDTPDEE